MEQLKYAYFKNGFLYDVAPRNNPDSLYEDRDIAYQADIIVSDGISYDLSVLEDIGAIPIPDLPVTENATSELSYILKIRCGIVEDAHLIPTFVDKVIALMQASHMLWDVRDYLQVIRNYYRHGLFTEGDAYEQNFKSQHPNWFDDFKGSKTEYEHEQTKRYFKKKHEKRTRS